MAALATLSATILARECGVNDPAVLLASTTGIVPGTRLYVDKELMAVISLGLGTSVNVRRGDGGTATARHAPEALCVMGRADQFYEFDPPLSTANEPLVNPWINVVSGRVWLQQGEELGNNRQYWQEVTMAHRTGALGLPSVVLSAGGTEYRLADVNWNTL